MCRVLVCVPDLSLPGGVTQLFNSLKLNNQPGFDYFCVNHNTGRYRILFLPLVYLSFISRSRRMDVIHLNPSMDARSFFRDMIFCILTRNFSTAKLIVYWHGWDYSFFEHIANHRVGQALFIATFGKADTHIVLGKRFAHMLDK